MNALVIKGNWNIFKGLMKQTMARLARSDSQFVEGKKCELIGRMERRTGKALHGVNATR